MKREKVKVEWFTPFPGLEELVPPIPAPQKIPEWIKKMPAVFHTPVATDAAGPRGTHRDASTFKVCPGYIDLYRQSYIMPMWCDTKIKATRKGVNVDFATNAFTNSVHPGPQFFDHAGESARKDYIIVSKPISPWHCRTPPGWGMLQLPLQYEFNPDFTVAMGILHTDVIHEINPQMMIRHENEILIQVGDPIAMYMPIKLDKAVDRETEIGYVTPDQQRSYQRGSLGTFLKFTQGYRLLIERLNKYV